MNWILTIVDHFEFNMKSLETIYLANVVLYFTGFHDLFTFGIVNSKCFDALLIIRQFPYCLKISKKPFKLFEMKQKIDKIQSLLINIETISVPNSLFLHILNTKIKQIRLNFTTLLDLSKYNANDNIIYMKIVMNKDDYIDFSVFRYLKNIYLVDLNYKNDTNFILDTTKRYSSFRYKGNCFNVQPLYLKLKECNIEKTILDIIQDQEIDISNSILNTLPNVCFYKRDLTEKDVVNKLVIYRNNKTKITNEYDEVIEQFNKFYLPSQLYVKSFTKSISTFTQLTSIDCDTIDDHPLPSQLMKFQCFSYKNLILPEQLLSLNIKIYNNLQIPVSLTSLFLEQSTIPICCEEEIGEGFNIFKCPCLRDLVISYCDIGFTSLKPMRNLTHIGIYRKFPTSISFNQQLFPLSLQKLISDEYLLPKQLNINKLTINCSSTSKVNLLQYTKLTSLKIYSICHKNFVFPCSLTRLHLFHFHNRIQTLDLSQEPSLNEIIIENCKTTFFVKLPEDLCLLCIINTNQCLLTASTNVEKVIIKSSLMDLSRINSKVLILN